MHDIFSSGKSRNSGSTSQSSSGDNSGAGAIGWLIGVILVVLVVVWIAVNVVIPVALLNSALAFTIVAFVVKRRRTLFSILALVGGCYMFFDVTYGWFSANFVNNVVGNAGWITAFVYINSAAIGLCTWFLVLPVWEKATSLADTDKQKHMLLKTSAILIVVIATALIPILYSSINNHFTPRQQSLNTNSIPTNSPDYSPQQTQVPVTENTIVDTVSKVSDSPFYVISVAAVQDETAAIQKVSELQEQGQSAGYLWIPDYASLSGALFYSIYIGPYATQEECEIAIEEYRKTHPTAYGILVSQERQRVEIRGIGKVTIKPN